MKATHAFHHRILPISAAILTALLCQSPVHAQMSGATTPHILELLGILPAATYDPYQSQIPRRRPGHAPEPLPMFVEQNPDAVNPAPVDQAGEFLPVPDRWRIMESLVGKERWWDPVRREPVAAVISICSGAPIN